MSEVLNATMLNEETIQFAYRTNGELRTHMTRAEFSIFLRDDQFTPELRRALERDPWCSGYSKVSRGGWIRTRWRGYDARKTALEVFDKKGVRTFEGDVHPIKRWLADHPEVGIAKPRRVYLDFETDSRVPFSRKHEMRIPTWGLSDGKKTAGVLEADTDSAERALLVALLQALAPYDQVCAWNGRDFDFEVLRARAKLQMVDLRTLRRWLWLDHMLAYKKYTSAESGEEKVSYSLDAVTRLKLGEGKHDFNASKTWEAWRAGGEARQRMVDYCVQDADLLRRLEEKTGYLKLYQSIAEVCGIFPDTRGLFPTVQMDGFMMRLGHRRDFHFPTSIRTPEGEEPDQFAGAYVMAPTTKGIVRNVHVCDFSSLYPSTIISWNMSPETKREGPANGPIPEGMSRAPTTGICFDVAGERGILPEALVEVQRMRSVYSKEQESFPPGTPEWEDAASKSKGCKVFGLAMWGAIGNSGSRFHDRSIAESTTLTGKWLIEHVQRSAAEAGIDVIYIDTDSNFCRGVDRPAFEGFVEWCNGSLFPSLLATQRVKENAVHLAYEKEYERIVFAKKTDGTLGSKRYVARYKHYKGKDATAESKPEIKGLEYRRGRKSRLARELQAETIDLLCGGMKIAKVEVPTEDVAHYEAAVARMRSRVFDGPLAIEEVSVSTGISKDLKEYAEKLKKDGSASSQPAHIRVAKEMAKAGQDVGVGTKIAYVVVDASTKPPTVIPASAYTGECDRYHIWKTVVWPPTRRLLESAFPEHDWAKFDPTRAKEHKLEKAGQLTVRFDAPAPEVLAPPLPPLVLRLEPNEEESNARIAKLKALCDRMPGNRQIVLNIVVGEGTAIVDVPQRVRATRRFLSEARELVGAIAVGSGACERDRNTTHPG